MHKPTSPRQPNPGEARTILLRRAAGATVDRLTAAYPRLDSQAVKALADDPGRVRDAFAAASSDARRRARAWVEAHPAAAPEPEIPAALPERVAVTLPKDRGADEAPVVYLARLDHDEIRRLRGEGLSWAELKTRFKLPGQVLRAVAGDVDPHQGEQDRAVTVATTSAATTVTASSGTKRRRAATYEENLSIARRVHAGEPVTSVSTDTGFAVSTVQATYRWARREQLLDELVQGG